MNTNSHTKNRCEGSLFQHRMALCNTVFFPPKNHLSNPEVIERRSTSSVGGRGSGTLSRDGAGFVGKSRHRTTGSFTSSSFLLRGGSSSSSSSDPAPLPPQRAGESRLCAKAHSSPPSCAARTAFSLFLLFFKRNPRLCTQSCSEHVSLR